MRLEHFPPEFYDICAGVLDGREYSMVLPTVAQARARRNKFYQFRGKCRQEVQAGRLRELPIGLDEVSIEIDGLRIRFYPRSTSALATDMREMLRYGHAVKTPSGEYVEMPEEWRVRLDEERKASVAVEPPVCGDAIPPGLTPVVPSTVATWLKKPDEGRE